MCLQNHGVAGSAQKAGQFGAEETCCDCWHLGASCADLYGGRPSGSLAGGTNCCDLRFQLSFHFPSVSISFHLYSYFQHFGTSSYFIQISQGCGTKKKAFRAASVSTRCRMVGRPCGQFQGCLKVPLRSPSPHKSPSFETHLARKKIKHPTQSMTPGPGQIITIQGLVDLSRVSAKRILKVLIWVPNFDP